MTGSEGDHRKSSPGETLCPSVPVWPLDLGPKGSSNRPPVFLPVPLMDRQVQCRQPRANEVAPRSPQRQPPTPSPTVLSCSPHCTTGLGVLSSRILTAGLGGPLPGSLPEHLVLGRGRAGPWLPVPDGGPGHVAGHPGGTGGRWGQPGATEEAQLGGGHSGMGLGLFAGAGW